MAHNRAAFRELVTAAFNDDELRVFCSDNFEEVYNNFTGEQGKSDKVLALIDYVTRRNGFDRLASLVKQANSEQYELFAARLADQPEQSPVLNPAITAALVQTQEALKEDRSYLQRRFEFILGQIDLLSDYKALHDGLHDIEYIFYQNIIDNTKIVLDDKYAKRTLFGILESYRRVVSKLQDTARKNKVSKAEGTWIDQLDKAANDLEDGVNKSNKSQIDNATLTMNSVVGMQPTIINRKLYTAVAAYNGSLPEITDVMDKVRQKLDTNKVESDKFQRGINSLKQMNEKLSALIDEHNTWQDVDRELRYLPNPVEEGIPKFDQRWQVQRKMIEPYYTSNDEESSVLYRTSARLKVADEELKAALAANDPAEVGAIFRFYCSTAAERFYYVDKSVLELCEKLSLIRKELE